MTEEFSRASSEKIKGVFSAVSSVGSETLDLGPLEALETAQCLVERQPDQLVISKKKQSP